MYLYYVIPDLLERYRRGPEVLAMVLTGVFGEEEDYLPAPGKWSIRQLIAHLADAEVVGAYRMGPTDRILARLRHCPARLIR